MREGGKRGATPSPSFEATHQRRAVPGRSPDSQVTASQTAFPSLRKQQWPIAVLKHSLLTVARPCGNCTRFPFHSHDCREHLALTAADASKWESPGQFSEGETARAVRRVFGEAVRVPLIVIYGAGCLPPTGSTAGCALSRQAKADAVGGSSRPRRKYLTLRSDRCYDFAIGPKVLGSEPKGKRVEFPHGRATVISELAGEAGHCCFRQWEGSRWSVLAVSQETCLGIDEARCARERLGRKYTQVFRTTHPGISLPSAFHLQPCLPMKA